jgi:DNA-binding PadR family transcriptional regulator
MNETAALTEATYYILLSLWTPQHGYGIMQRAEELSEGRVRLAAGTLYGALSQLTTKGWIILLPVDEASRRKDYALTDKGRAVLKAEIERLRGLVRNGDRVVNGEDVLRISGGEVLREEEK